MTQPTAPQNQIRPSARASQVLALRPETMHDAPFNPMPFRFLLLVNAVLMAAEAPAAEKFTFHRPLMGTRFTVTCYAHDPIAAERAAHAAFALAEELNALASDYLPTSELAQLSAQPVGHPIPISPLLFDLLHHSRRLAEATDGAFDPTLGPLTRLWRTARAQRRLPSPQDLQAARAAVGWPHFTLDSQAQTLTLHREGMAFDLGGIAKGYAADRMLAYLTAAGLPQSLIAAGGDIRLGAAPPGRDGWRVALRSFDRARSDEVVILAHAAVSTSGDLYQAVVIEGQTYSHVLDPRAGLGLTRRIAASVVADDATSSDALATAACVLGPDRASMLRALPGVREVTLRAPLPSVSPHP